MQYPPFKEMIYGPDGKLSRVWHQWLDSLSTATISRLLSGTTGNLIKIIAGGNIGDSGKVPPTGVIVGTTDIQTLSNKTFGTIHQNNLVSKVADEDITGAWRIPKRPSTTYTNSDATLTSSHYGRVLKFDNGTFNATCQLPALSAGDVDKWLIIMRLGTGWLKIQASGTNVIEKSSPGGSVICQEAGRVVANLTLYSATASKWAIIGGTGIWIET